MDRGRARGDSRLSAEDGSRGEGSGGRGVWGQQGSEARGRAPLFLSLGARGGGGLKLRHFVELGQRGRRQPLLDLGPRPGKISRSLDPELGGGSLGFFCFLRLAGLPGGHRDRGKGRPPVSRSRPKEGRREDPPPFSRPFFVFARVVQEASLLPGSLTAPLSQDRGVDGWAGVRH